MTTAVQPRVGIVGDAQREHYRDHGYAVLRDVIPRELLDRGQRIIEPWIDHWTQTWDYRGGEPASDGEIGRRFLLAWRHAGRPHFRRTPNAFLINPAMYDFLRSERLLTLAEAIIGTPELSVHGIFNARPQLPDWPATMTPFHQDAQYWRLDYGAAPDVVGTTHVMTVWLPLVSVTAESGALGVISQRDCGRAMIEPFDYDFERTGFIGLSPERVATHTVIPIEMQPGDALIFNQLTPHGALPNLHDRVRWSIDVRYEATATATAVGRKFGFIAQSLADPASVTPVDEWLRKRVTRTRD